MYYQLTKNDILTALSIAGIKYDERGDSAWIICNFHNDQNPSMSIIIFEQSPLFGLCKCFSCGKTTSIQTLIRDVSGSSIYKLLNISNNDDFSSYQFVNTLNNYEKKTIDISNKKVFNLKGKFLKLAENTDAYNYLINVRKIGKHIINEFEMSYVKWLEINTEDIEDKYGRVEKKRTIFANRICTPIYYNDELVNIDGRDFTDNQTPKVLYPRETLKPLFNYNKLNKLKPLILDEGILNTFGVYEHIDKNCTALLGNQPNQLQIKQLNEFKEIILIPNNDKGSETLIKIIDEQYEGDLYIAKLDDKYNDVNEAVKDNNIDHLYKAFQNKKIYMETLLNKYELF
jgi:DNA primase